VRDSVRGLRVDLVDRRVHSQRSVGMRSAKRSDRGERRES
jgi:hypothetical protein